MDASIVEAIPKSTRSVTHPDARRAEVVSAAPADTTADYRGATSAGLDQSTREDILKPLYVEHPDHRPGGFDDPFVAELPEGPRHHLAHRPD